MKYKENFTINNHRVAADAKTYFIADIAANHDGDIERAKELIWLCKEAGADAAKFQHFLAKDIVSDKGFRDLGAQVSHQSKWKQSVYKIYEQYQCSRDWNHILIDTCKQAGIDFMTTPYDFEAVDMFANHVGAFKVGSGDVTWLEQIEKIAQQNKPVLIAVGASEMNEVEQAVDAVLKHNQEICLMQCNTNYTGELENFKYINLNVIKTFADKWPGMMLGLSDHTPGHATVLGAVAMGARIIEKHFTDDNNRTGPDHPFSMIPETWRDMIDRTRELEYALGDGVKRVEENEKETVVVQRRCLRIKSDIKAGNILKRENIEVLRPAPVGSLKPSQIDEIAGMRLNRDMVRGEIISKSDLRDD
ncbi:MAG: N-acetylneuraminate synthase family protein [Thioalkalispiraceae bacterium]|jgi:N-acetylneuraminate synthase